MRLLIRNTLAAGNTRNSGLNLCRGECQTDECCKRIAKGKEVWIQACYSPVFGRGGKVVKVLNVLTDLTASMTRAADDKSRVDAISRAQAVIDFSPDGVVLTANENFLKIMGYRLEDIVGQHHRMFVDPAYAQSSEYRENWDRIRPGRVRRRRISPSCQGRPGSVAPVVLQSDPRSQRQGGEGRQIRNRRHGADLIAFCCSGRL